MPALIMFLRQRPHDYAGYLSCLSNHGFRRVCLGSDNGPWLRQHDLLRRMGLEIEISKFTLPPDYQSSLHDMMVDTIETGATGWMPDVEARQFKQVTLAKKLDTSIDDEIKLAKFKGETVITSYPEFPIRKFANGKRRGVVQVYDRFDTQGKGFVEKRLNQWGEYGFSKVDPALGQFKLIRGKDGKLKAVAKPLPRFEWHLRSCPRTVERAYLWTTLDFQTNFNSAANKPYWTLLERFASGF